MRTTRKKERTKPQSLRKVKKGGKNPPRSSTLKSKTLHDKMDAMEALPADDSTITAKFLRKFHKYNESESVLIQLYNVFEGFRATEAIRILNKIKEELLLELNTEKRVSLTSSSLKPSDFPYSIDRMSSAIYGGFPPQRITPEMYEKFLKDHPEHSMALSENELKLFSLLFLIGMLIFMYESLTTNHGLQIRIKRFLAKMNRIRISNRQQLTELLSRRPTNLPFTYHNYMSIVFNDAVIDIEIPFDVNMENMPLREDPISFEVIKDNEMAIAIYEGGHSYYLFNIESFEDFIKNTNFPLRNPSTNNPIELNNAFMCRIHYYRS